mgnify:CR=1 FL=1
MRRTMSAETQPSPVGERPRREGDIRTRWAWVEPSVWTDRMLEALENGVKGSKWYSLMDKVYDLAHARNRFARQLRLSCNGQSNSTKLKEILAPYRMEEGGCPVTVAYHNGKAACEVSLGAAWQVQLHDHLLETLGQWLAPASVEVRY